MDWNVSKFCYYYYTGDRVMPTDRDPLGLAESLHQIREVGLCPSLMPMVQFRKTVLNL